MLETVLFFSNRKGVVLIVVCVLCMYSTRRAWLLWNARVRLVSFLFNARRGVVERRGMTSSCGECATGEQPHHLKACPEARCLPAVAAHHRFALLEIPGT